MQTKNRLSLFVFFALLLLARASIADDRSQLFQPGSGLSFGAGLDFSTGTYGTPDTTTVTSIPLYGQYQTKDWLFKLTIPFVDVAGNGNVLPGLGRVDNSNSRGRGRDPGDTTGSASGPGDIVGSATYNMLYDANYKWGLDLTGTVKLGTADPDKGLGTGENDYGAQVDVYKNLDNNLTLYTGLGYTILGSSDFIHLNNVFNFVAGGSLKLDAERSVGLQYDAREKVTDDGSPLNELTAFYTQKLDPQWKLQAYVLKGFSDGSPDWGAGVTMQRAF